MLENISKLIFQAGKYLPPPFRFKTKAEASTLSAMYVNIVFSPSLSFPQCSLAQDMELKESPMMGTINLRGEGQMEGMDVHSAVRLDILEDKKEEWRKNCSSTYITICTIIGDTPKHYSTNCELSTKILETRWSILRQN